MVDKLILTSTRRRPTRLLSSLMRSDDSKCNHNFTLKSGKEFATRSQNVFQELKAIEVKYDSHIPEDTCEQDEIPSCSNLIDTTSDVFKKPAIPVYRKRKFMQSAIPDYKRHPQKWIKYSLADTPDVSDESNKMAAMQFLGEMRNRIKKVEVSENCADKLLFLKPEQLNVCEKQSSSTVLKSSFLDTKHVMPDCIVGKQNPPKKLKNKIPNKKIQVNSVKLDHLDSET